MKLKAFYGLPEKVIFCKKTLISNQLPSSTPEFTHTIKSKKKTTFIDKNFISDPWKYSRLKKKIDFKEINTQPNVRIIRWVPGSNRKIVKFK